MNTEKLDELAARYIAISDEIDRLNRERTELRRQMVGLTWGQAQRIARLGFYISVGQECPIGFSPHQVLDREDEFAHKTKSSRRLLANSWSRKAYDRQRETA